MRKLKKSQKASIKKIKKDSPELQILPENTEAPKVRKLRKRYKKQKCAFVDADGKRCKTYAVGKSTLCARHGGSKIDHDNLVSAIEKIRDRMPIVTAFNPAVHPLEFINLSRQGLSEVEIAAQFKVGVTALRKWSEKYVEFATAYEIGQALHESWWLQQGKGNLNNRHYNTTLFKFLTTNKLGYAEKIETKSTSMNMHGVLLVPDKVSEAEWEEANVQEAQEVKEKENV